MEKKDLEVYAYSVKNLGICEKSNGQKKWWNFSSSESDLSKDEMREYMKEELDKGDLIELFVVDEDKGIYSNFSVEGKGNSSSDTVFSGGSSKKSSKSYKDKMDDYITWEETLEKAHEQFDELSIKTELMDLERENGKFVFALVRARVECDKGVFTGIGDATEDNVNSMVKIHLPRMAETRAKVRALKDSLGIGKTSKEEIEKGDN